MLRSLFRLLASFAAALLAACSDGGTTTPFLAGAAAPPGGLNSAPSVLTVTPTTISRAATTADYGAYASVQLDVTNVPATGLWVGLDDTGVAVDYTYFDNTGTPTVWIVFKQPSSLGAGTYQDTVTIRVCYDDRCSSQVQNSPAAVPVTLVVAAAGSEGPPPQDPPPEEPPPEGPQPEPGIEALPVIGQQPLAHDVIDAEYSAALNAIVMVSSYPSPALHVHDPVNGTEQSIALDKVPSSVSVSPDGLGAAVGHDALITVVDLTRLNDPIVSPKTLLNVTADVLDVVLAGNGYVYGFPRRDQWSRIHSIRIATNTETLSTGYSIYAGTVAKLHPSGTRMYGANNGLSPSDIERYGIANGTASNDYDSPYHGDYAMCGNLWMNEAGAQIYTACGNVFRSSDARANDMIYAGALALTPNQYYGTRIESLSHSAERREVALLDEDPYHCSYGNVELCYTHLGLYESDYLQLQVRYSLGPVEVAGQAYAQRGLFVFHSADGSKRYLISRLTGMPNPDHEYLVGSVDVAGSPPPDPEPEPVPPPVVNPSTEPGIDAAPLTESIALPHDVVDAEFSAALNAIVIVSSYPSNALHVHDLATRTERSITLVKSPTSVSVSPDGLRAAVGHDALVSLIDLAPAGATAPKLLAASLDVLDVVLAGNGYVYAFPRVDQWQNIHSIHIDTGVETASFGSIYAGTLARLHPAGTKMYGADNGLSPSDIERYSISEGTAQIAYDSPYHGDYAMCGNLWFSENGVNIFTACGNAFRSSDVQSQDMVYAGALQLSTSGYYGYRVVWASESTEAGQVALIEQDAYACSPYGSGTCNSHVNLYTSSFFQRTARYSLSPFTVGQDTYPQRGMFVFHSGDGTRRWVVSRLSGMPNPYAEYYLSRLP